MFADELKNNPPPKLKLRPEILLDAPLPVPMHGTAPRVVLGDAWWTATKADAMAKTGRRCAACGAVAASCHERYDIDWLLGRMVYVETVPLCKPCHCYCHLGYMRVQLDKGQITQVEYDNVLKHGKALTKGMRKQESENHNVPWGDWRLVVDGVEYPPVFASFDEYKENFGL